MKIIHTADIHLDSNLTTNLSGDKKTTRKNELLQTFKKLVEFAHSEHVEAIIIAGDFFDKKTVSQKTKHFVFSLISTYSHIKFFYLCGNHDENKTVLFGESLPDNLYIFGEEISSFRLKDVVISGTQLNHKNFKSFYDNIQLSKDDVNIFVLHGQVDGKAKQDDVENINIKQLANKHINYLALGHYHTFQTGTLDKRGIYCYSGCLEGRGFDETGQKGFVLLNVENGNITHNFIPFAQREIVEVFVDVTNKTSHLESEKAIREAALNIKPNSLVSIVLTGEVTVNDKIDVSYLQTLFEKEYYFVKITNNTKLKLNINDYKNDISLKGEFIRCVLNSKMPEHQKEEVILMGLNALLGEEVV